MNEKYIHYDQDLNLVVVDDSGSGKTNCENVINVLFNRCNNHRLAWVRCFPYDHRFTVPRLNRKSSKPEEQWNYELGIIPITDFKMCKNWKDVGRRTMRTPLNRVIYSIYNRVSKCGKVYKIDTGRQDVDPKNLMMIENGTFKAKYPYPATWKVKFRNEKISSTGSILRRPIARLTENNVLIKQISKSKYLYETEVLHDFVKNGYEIDHIDGNPLNDNLKNLRILTRDENKLKMYLNRENPLSVGTKIFQLKCPVCGKIFQKNQYLIRTNDRIKNASCSKSCAASRTSKINSIPLDDLLIKTWIEFSVPIQLLTRVGPDGFYNSVSVINRDKPIPVFKEISQFTSDNWLNVFYKIYYRRLINGINCGENKEFLNRFVYSLEEYHHSWRK